MLPLLQFLLEKLWESRTAEGLLTFAAYKRLGGLEGALGNKAEEVFKNDLGKAEQEAFRGVLRLLVTVGQGGAGRGDRAHRCSVAVCRWDASAAGGGSVAVGARAAAGGGWGRRGSAGQNCPRGVAEPLAAR